MTASPYPVARDTQRIKGAALKLWELAEATLAAYLELDDAAHSVSQNGDVHTRRAGWVGTDPTGDVAISGEKRAMRRHLRKAARLLARRPVCPQCGELGQGIPQLLEQAQDEIARAFAGTDPEWREHLREAREVVDKGLART